MYDLHTRGNIIVFVSIAQSSAIGVNCIFVFLSVAQFSDIDVNSIIVFVSVAQSSNFGVNCIPNWKLTLQSCIV